MLSDQGQVWLQKPELAQRSQTTYLDFLSLKELSGGATLKLYILSSPTHQGLQDN